MSSAIQTLNEIRQASQTHRKTICFSSYSISSRVDLLYRGDSVAPLEPRAVRVLRYLAENSSRVVTKEELLDAVWPDTFTTDGVLKRAVSQVRRALGDEAGKARFIETYYGRGYRFIAPVSLSFEESNTEGASEERFFQSGKPDAMFCCHMEPEEMNVGYRRKQQAARFARGGIRCKQVPHCAGSYSARERLPPFVLYDSFMLIFGFKEDRNIADGP